MGTYNQADINKPFLKKQFDKLCYFSTIIFFSFLSTTLYAQIPAAYCDGDPADWENYTTNPNHPVIYIKDAANSINGDDQFFMGSKIGDEISDWHWTLGNSNDKTDITNAGGQLVDGCILRFFGDRTAVNGDASIGIWAFKDAISLNSDGTFSGVHTNGDVLIESEFTDGGGTSTIAAFVWLNGSLIPVSVGSNACAGVNSSEADVPPPLSYTPKAGDEGTYPIGAFFEGAIDLCELGISPCFASFLVATWHSQEGEASLDDLAAPGSFNTNPDAPTVTVTQPTCTTPTGCLTVTAPVGAGYTYSLDGGDFQSDPQFCNLKPGEHCIRVKKTDNAVVNNDGCISEETCKTINESPEPPGPPELEVRQPTCDQPTGCLIVTSPRGEGYSYSIDDGPFQTGRRFCGLLPGEHCIKVKFGGCISDETCETINEVPEKPTCTIIPPYKKPIAHSTGNQLCANATAGVTYKWIIRGTGWVITGGQGTSCITYTAGAAGSSAKFILKVTKDGCYSKCTITITCIRRATISSVTAEEQQSVMTSGKPLVKAYPNPFQSEVNFNVVSPVSGKALLEIYDLLGRKLALVYDGKVDAGANYTFKYKAPVTNGATLVYKLTVGKETYHGILIPRK